MGLASLAFAAYIAYAALQPGLTFFGNRGPNTADPRIEAGLSALFVVVGLVVLQIRSATGERAILLRVSRDGAEFRYPSGRTYRIDWKSSRAHLVIRRYALHPDTLGVPREGIYCGGVVRTLLTAEAFEALVRRAGGAGRAARSWTTRFPVHQTHTEI